ncbi:PREDICTED: transmembrane protein 56 [Crocodylus porosus]|uniref:transmembrane protein 56 n=1 Tax=Crocodylus porosus TaxID=8502 RepID=UPI00093AB7C5|nr:PREDICTED: transmembrane protein 56 [Crocodylus porosus]XP_019386608.1 PREDICTED: transmembrane protein 56 [Crocodylus porosus]XP_019386609.1 PREDICTED: transmembrane protein 56 [Crocodylus porosus]XP_019386610.1 PREDICTED: transmembrane protein 56 [Crocodylus porosus]
MAAFNKLIIGIAVTSFTIFQLLFHVLSAWASAWITPGFNSLNQKRKIEWNSRTVSTFHALVVGVFCVYILMYDEAVNADPIWGDPSIVKLNIAITTGYLISDLLLVTYYWKAIGDIFFVIHHLMALYAYYFVLGEGLLAYFGNFRLLAEFSTPFVNQRWFFEVLGYPKSSKANIINGVLMTVVFFMVRIAVIPFYYGRVVSAFGTEAFQRLGLAAQSAWIISSVVLDVMNLMWMFKITKGCYKVICLIGQEEAKTRKNGKSE